MPSAGTLMINTKNFPDADEKSRMSDYSAILLFGSFKKNLFKGIPLTVLTRADNMKMDPIFNGAKLNVTNFRSVRLDHGPWLYLASCLYASKYNIRFWIYFNYNRSCLLRRKPGKCRYKVKNVHDSKVCLTLGLTDKNGACGLQS